MVLINGSLASQTLRANLSYCMPATHSFRAYFHKHVKEANVVESVLRCAELKRYLEENNLPLVVSLSEDATRNLNRVQYDPATNQLVGFSLPINNNGMPSPNSFLARSASENEQHFLLNSEHVASFVNVIMSQPLVLAYPPFCLLIFGSDNKYTASDVVNRWLYAMHALNQAGIQVLSIASDSDPKYKAAMRRFSKLGTANTRTINKSWFQCGMFNNTVMIQDTEHIATKLRNAFLKTKKNLDLTIGDYTITISHLEFRSFKTTRKISTVLPRIQSIR